MKLNYEIERKFLVTNPSSITQSWRPQHDIVQCYLNNTIDECNRIRVSTTKNFNGATASYTCNHTYKKRINDIKRIETEHNISLIEAIQAISESDSPVQTKIRYIVPYGQDDIFWEIDVFSGNNIGLIVAEIEIPNEKYDLIIPDWVGEEVTHDMKYTNVQLSVNPFTNWE